MPYKKRYPFVWANGIFWGSREYYVRDEERRAREDNAPEDAVYWRNQDPDDITSPRVWTTMRELKDACEKHGGGAYDALMKIATDRWWVAD